MPRALAFCVWYAFGMPKAYPSYLAGQNHPRNRKRSHPELKRLWKRGASIAGVNSLLRAEREPDNPYDPYAVGIWLVSPRVRLGYLPERHLWVGEAMDEGKEIHVWIEGMQRKGGWFRRKYYVDLAIQADRRE